MIYLIGVCVDLVVNSIEHHQGLKSLLLRITLAESLAVDEKHSTDHLRYMYRFHIMRTTERKQTTGAGELKLVEGGTKLKGHCLTDSPTQGSIEQVFVQRDVDGFDTFKVVRGLYEARFSALPTALASGDLAIKA